MRILLAAACGPGLLLLLLCLGTPGRAAPTGATSAETLPSIHVGERGEVRVYGLFAASDHALARTVAESLEPDRWREILHVVARDPSRELDASELPPLLGRYELDAGVLRFVPRFPPAPELTIEATFDLGRWHATLGRDGAPVPALEASRRIAEREIGPSTQVEAIRPTGPVPANLLRLYVHFSAPMAARGVLPHVRLLDDGGEEVPLAFVEVPGGLWNGDRTRLTLFVHPGRIKHGVAPNQALGPVLEAGRTYRLWIDAEARDARGRPLAEPFEHVLDVGPADHRSPDPATWIVESPATPRAELLVRLPRPADVALLERLLHVSDDGGDIVPGRFEAATDGRSVRFRPAEAWTAGPYRLVVPVALEDAAGNRVNRRFEEPDGGAQPSRVSEPILVEFRVGFRAAE